MKYLERLIKETDNSKNEFLNDIDIQRLLSGKITLNEYVYFLWQSHFHMVDAVSAFGIASSRFDKSKYFSTSKYYLYHAHDEYGEERWCLNDMKLCGVDFSKKMPERSPACIAFISYLFQLAERENPIALLCDSYVVEGIANDLGTNVLGKIKESLKINDKAYTYLGRHAEIDVKHFQEFANLLEETIKTEDDFKSLVTSVRTMFWIFKEFLKDIAKNGEVKGKEMF
jgi:thiaminase